MQRFVFRSDRSEQQTLALPLHGFLQVRRIGSNRKVASSGGSSRIESDVRGHCQDAFEVDDQGVDFKLGNLGNFGQQLRDGQQHAMQGCFIHGWRITPSRQQACDPGARDQGPCQRHVQGWQGDRAVRHDFLGRATLAKQNDRSKYAVDAAAQHQFLCVQTRQRRIGARAGKFSRRHRDLASFQHGTGLVFIQCCAAVGQRASHDGLDGGRVRTVISLQRRGGFCQFGLVAPVTRQHGERQNGLLRRIEVGDAGILKGLSCLRGGIFAQPTGQQARGRAWLVPGHRYQGLRNFGAGHSSAGGMDEQHSAAVGCLLQQAKRLLVPCHRCIAQNVHRVVV